jgi:hypothetical protein
VIGEPAKCEGYWNLQEKANSSHGIANQGTKTKTSYNRRGIGIKRSLGAIVTECDQKMDPDAPIQILTRHKRHLDSGVVELLATYCPFKCSQLDLLLLLALHWVVKKHTGLQDM